jgi:hypothetical protein
VHLFVAREEVHIDDQELLLSVGRGLRGELGIIRNEDIEPKERQAEAILQLAGDVFESLCGER